MGPRRCRRGRPNGWGSLRLVDTGFNGATPLSAWKTSDEDRRPVDIRLQWGHADVGVEDEVLRILTEAMAIWLQWGHADVGVEDQTEVRRRITDRSGFNGATPMSAWKTSIT